MSINSKLKSDCVSMFRRPRSVRIETGKGNTEQSKRMECDVNVIIKRYRQTGMLPPSVHAAHPQFIDVTGFGDFHTSMTRVAAAQSAFASLPSEVRAKYKNNPELYVEGLKSEVEKDRNDKRIKRETDERIKKEVAKAKSEPPPKPD